jgi:Domain of unknown function (DUF4410)
MPGRWHCICLWLAGLWRHRDFIAPQVARCLGPVFGSRARKETMEVQMGGAVRKVMILGVMLMLAACSSSGSIEMKQPKTAAIPAGKVVALNVTAPADEDSADALHLIRNELFGRLVAEGVFKEVVAAEEPADYRMDVVLSNVDEVSQGARIFFGVLAGSNELKAAVTVIDAATAQPVTSFNVGGESASHPMSSENGLEDAVREAVTRIIGALT